MSDTTNLATGPGNPRPFYGPGDTALTAQQMESAAAALAKHWTGSPEVLRQRLADIGVQPAPQDPAPADPDEAAVARAFGGASASDYDLSGVFAGRDLSDIEEASPFEAHVALDGMLRSAMQEMGIPKAIGRGFAEYVLDAAQAWGSMTEAQRAVHSEREISTAVQVTRAPSREAMMETIRPVLAKLDPDTAQAFAEAGVFEGANTLIQLYLQGKRAAALAR